ncbi:MAG: helix-turn-helix transcriptional regulator [Lachnospiraceae bacterium]|jgi:transcriptional regulator with XRE-family HTH domain|nr:helix-turn-helix transcriptional regulator [Lachnospiraceae bacterium]
MDLNLRQLRKAHEISQEQMAKLCEVHRNTYAIWERKPGKIPVDRIVTIARELDIGYETIVKICTSRK